MVFDPIRTELLPREAPKLLPLTVTRVLVLPLCGEMLRIQGEVMVSLAVSLPVAVITCRLPVRAPVGTRTWMRVSPQLTYWEKLGSVPP